MGVPWLLMKDHNVAAWHCHYLSKSYVIILMSGHGSVMACHALIHDVTWLYHGS